MPEKRTLARARRDRREGKAATTQAGEFVREEMEHAKEGKHPVKGRKQAIAIGLSKARRAGVKVPRKKRGAGGRGAAGKGAARKTAARGGARKSSAGGGARKSSTARRPSRSATRKAPARRAGARGAAASRKASPRKAARRR
ncbi:DUF6496 domain-containing protein [Anaeromyxobacter paludicola]|uniref:Transcription elongation factor n=1 Tax=Anaeromyxobacter paludicola TaxID=2918171 RepID=A0ABM7XBD8_9BACT|nr:DUF6496 domain-containing protein [Anaeromyxobacter paludicola]BDG09184.1 hypothetical protein AMPC_22970 [Anaeromyxobacter paludicola]